MDFHSLFTGSEYSEKKRFPKTNIFHGSKKILLQYCGRHQSDTSSDMSHSNSFESTEGKDHFDTAHGFTRIAEKKPFRNNYINTYCLLCYKREKGRRPDLHPSTNGPWKTHTVYDEYGTPQCPLLYFSTCECGSTGADAHLPEDCPIAMALRL